ncbi:MAG: YggS family pyridoxal phosphate-dependent enzyme [Syntrophomonas sp.]
MINDLRVKLENVKQRIERAANRSGRTASDVTLVAVSKTVNIETVNRAYELGICDFGENRCADLHTKQETLPGARWHMIGRLQTNKVKDIVGKAWLIHSLDRWNLAEELDKRGSLLDMDVPALLQVNISGEEQKAGIDQGDVAEFLDSAGQLKKVKIWGFMTIAPLLEDGEQARPVFQELAQLKKKHSDKKYANVDLKYLSMGMSQDFEVAIEEGANIVRVGGAIFS